MTVYSDRVLEIEPLEHVIADAEFRLSKSPINRPADHYNVFIANTGWRRGLLFAPAGSVGGVVYFPFFGQNVFLSGADLDQNRLISPMGYIPAANRTLSYFIAHEITHLQQGATVGAFGFVMMPAWIREGYADRVGLSHPSDHDQLAASLKRDPIDVEHWNRFGYYSSFRYVVGQLIDGKGWDVSRLLKCRLSFDEAKKLAEVAEPVSPRAH